MSILIPHKMFIAFTERSKGQWFIICYSSSDRAW